MVYQQSGQVRLAVWPRAQHVRWRWWNRGIFRVAMAILRRVALLHESTLSHRRREVGYSWGFREH